MTRDRYQVKELDRGSTFLLMDRAGKPLTPKTMKHLRIDGHGSVQFVSSHFALDMLLSQENVHDRGSVNDYDHTARVSGAKTR
jgi:hypothetical protein